MTKHYNVVISINFEDKKQQEEYIEFIKSQKGITLLYTGVHDSTVYQRVTTQKLIGE